MCFSVNDKFISNLASCLNVYCVERRFYVVSGMLASAYDRSAGGLSSLSRRHNNFWNLEFDSRWAAEKVRNRGVDFAKYETFEAGVLGYSLYLSCEYPDLRGCTSVRQFLRTVEPNKAEDLIYLIIQNKWGAFDPDIIRPESLDYEQIIEDIIAGKYGRGLECRQRVTAMGYSSRKIAAMLKWRLTHGK